MNESEPFIPLAIPNISGREAEYLAECVRSTFVSTVGPFVGRFEEMVSDAAGTPSAVATSAGTTGLHASLVALGVGPGDLVISPALTFVASVNAISHSGARPWLFDVDPNRWTLSPTLVADCLARETHRDGAGALRLTQTGERVAAIMPVFTLGIPAEMDELVALGNEYSLPVIVDAAAALGSTYMDRPIGALGAALTMFSFNGNKTVTAGGGGAIVGEDEVLLETVRHLTTTARVGADYDHDRIGFNYRMTNLQAAVGCAQMERLDEFVAAKRRISATYDAALAHIAATRSFPSPEDSSSVAWFSGLVLEDQEMEAIIKLRQDFRSQGIDVRPFWKPMHMQVPYALTPRTEMPVCEDLWWRILTLPCSSNLTEHEQDRVIVAVSTALKA